MAICTSVVICTYNDPVDTLRSCIESVLRQRRVEFEIIVVDSSDTDNIKRLTSILSEKIRYVYAPAEGLAFARNVGIKNTQYNIVAFTDSDCIANENWLEELCKPFDLFKDTAISSGKVIPIWPQKIPFFLKSDYARFSLSVLDLGDKPKFVEDDQMIVGANFAIDKKKIEKMGFFDTRMGRKSKTLLSGEETELCSRVRKEGYKIFYSPEAVVYHKISSNRLTYRWMVKRTFWGGLTRAKIGRRFFLSKREIGAKKLNCYDILYILFFSAPYLLGYLYGKLKRREMST